MITITEFRISRISGDFSFPKFQKNFPCQNSGIFQEKIPEILELSGVHGRKRYNRGSPWFSYIEYCIIESLMLLKYIGSALRDLCDNLILCYWCSAKCNIFTNAAQRPMPTEHELRHQGPSCTHKRELLSRSEGGYIS